jgi:hypothetical protein
MADQPAPRQWPQRVAATVTVLFSLGLAAFAIDRQSGIDWQQVLAGVRHSWGSDLPQLQASAPAPVDTPSVTRPAAAPAAARRTGVTNAARIPVATTATVAAGTPRVGFAAASYDVAAGEPAARIEVRRLGGGDGEMSFIWWTEEASARPDVDYAELGRRIEKIPSGADKITLFVPIISNPQRAQPSRFYVALDNTGAAAAARAGSAEAGIVGPGTRAAVTIDRGE